MGYVAGTREAKILECAKSWPEYARMAVDAIEDGTSFSNFQKQILEAEQARRGSGPGATPGLEVGENLSHSPQWRKAARDYVLLRTLGRLPDATDQDRAKRTAAAEEAGAQCRGDTITHGMAERCRRGPPMAKGDDFFTRVFQGSTSDFPDILVDAANVALQAAFAAQPKNWLTIGRVRPVPDYKTINSTKVGAVNMALTPENVPVQSVIPADDKTSYRLQTYTAEMGISRQVFTGGADDALAAFIGAGEAFAEASNRVIGDVVFNLLTSASGVGPTMTEDSKALFATDHTSGANYIAGTGAPDAAGIAALSLLMRKQKGFVRAGETAPSMNIVPRYLLAPAALAAQAQITLASLSSAETDDDNDPAIVRAPRLLVEPRLDAATNGATAWYLISTDCPGLELGFRKGKVSPSLVQQRFDWMGFSAVALLDFGCTFVEHRGFARSRGA